MYYSLEDISSHMYMLFSLCLCQLVNSIEGAGRHFEKLQICVGTNVWLVDIATDWSILSGHLGRKDKS